MIRLEATVDEGLNAAVYNELRQRLIHGRMSPGHELSTRSIAAELGVSQTPVRDALSRLAAEGALASADYFGFFTDYRGTLPGS